MPKLSLTHNTEIVRLFKEVLSHKLVVLKRDFLPTGLRGLNMLSG